MSILLQINNLKKAYGPHIILDGANFSVAEKQKIGVVGRNGAGKSTLFKIIIGSETADSGETTIHDRTRIGYIKQEDDFTDQDTVLPYLLAKSGKEEWQCAKTAAQFELKNELLEKKILELSGGFQMRVKLALMLLHEPNLLLLDEPTNYLDLRTMLLLERFLKGYNGAYLVISHDRRFLKNTCKETLEIENGRAFHFPGNLEAYLSFKKEKLLQTEKYNKKQIEKQKHLQKFIDRFGAKATLATQAKSKAKQIDRIKLLDIENTLSTAVIKIPKANPTRGLAFVMDKSAIGYGKSIVADDITIEVYRGEHIALLGDNGQGKSTLLKTLATELEFLRGNARTASGLKIAYYAQHTSARLSPKDTVESYLESQAAGSFTLEEIRRMAGNFLFSDSDIKKPISVLSGGEKARLCLAGIFLTSNDALLLDEPTNHLDFETAEALATALAISDATIIFTSHDRTFTSIVADSIIEVKNKKIKRLFGDYEEYLEKLQDEIAAANGTGSKQTNEGKEERKKIYEEEKKNKKELLKLEKKLEILNKEKAELHKYFEENYSSPAPEKTARLDEVEKEIEAAEDEWIGITVGN